MSYFPGRSDEKPAAPFLDMRLVDEALLMQQGYVLDFSDAQFDDFVQRRFGIDAAAPTYTVDGTSKAKRLRALLRALVPGAQAEVLRAFWQHRKQARTQIASMRIDPALETDFLAMVAHLEGSAPPIDTSGVGAFSKDATLTELIAAIQRDINANAPQAALDRLHTYCMKRFADLLARDGQPATANEALHARAGRYINSRRRSGQISDYSDKIAKSVLLVMEQFNSVRNNRSLAHDNTILSLAEGRYVFETVTSLLRFIEALD